MPSLIIRMVDLLDTSITVGANTWKSRWLNNANQRFVPPSPVSVPSSLSHFPTGAQCPLLAWQSKAERTMLSRAVLLLVKTAKGTGILNIKFASAQT